MPQDSQPQDKKPKNKDDAPPLSEFIDKLAEKGAVTVDGKTVDAAALKKELKDKNVALSFGFQGCKGLCPTINHKHAVLEGTVKAADYKGNKDSFVTMVVDVFPPDDKNEDKNKESRAAYVQEVKDAGNTHHKVIGIFPKTKEDAKELQKMMKLFTTSAHSSMITLYDKDGQYIGRKDTMQNSDEVFKKWGEEYLNKPATPAEKKEEKKTGMLNNPLGDDPKVALAMQDFAASLVRDSSDYLVTPAGKAKNGKSSAIG